MNKKTIKPNTLNTTLVLKKTLRDKLMQLKYKFNLDDLNQTLQLIYDSRNETLMAQLK